MITRPYLSRYNGFSLIEVMLSIAILSIIVYSVFVVFDRSIKVLDDIFVGAHRYEQVKVFFSQISKELSSALVGSTEQGAGFEEVYVFRGGPYWIEFGTPLLNESSIEDYIRKGVNMLEAAPTKLFYFGARNSTYNVNANVYASDGPKQLFQTHIFRIIPVNNIHQNIVVNLSKSDYSEDFYIDASSWVAKYPVPVWLERPDYQSYAKTPAYFESSGLSKYYKNFSEVLMCRGIKFRYFYNFVSHNGTKDEIREYSQDWWDSNMRYPFQGKTESDNFKILYSNPTDYFKAIESERARRFKDIYLAPSATDAWDQAYYTSKWGTEGWSYDERWQYENEPSSFRAFAKYDPLVTKGTTDYFLFDYLFSENHFSEDQRKLDYLVPGQPDPWFNKPPMFVEITVYLYDNNSILKLSDSDVFMVKNVASSRFYPTISDSTNSSKKRNKLKEAYRGETFSLKVYMRTHSSSVYHYQKDLVQE